VAQEAEIRAPDAVAKFRSGDPAVVRAVRRLILDVLRAHSHKLKPYWDDLVLEVCAQAWQCVRDSGDGVQSLAGLVARIAHARVIDLHRHRSRWRIECISGKHIAGMTDGSPGPYEDVVRAEASAVVAAVIAAVDERTRAIWRVRYFEGLKYREAAVRLGMPEGTVKRLVYESLRAAARRFADGGVRDLRRDS
jgi:RNA polymerase sigma-70 factor (ECF subfamily)